MVFVEVFVVIILRAFSDFPRKLIPTKIIRYTVWLGNKKDSERLYQLHHRLCRVPRPCIGSYHEIKNHENGL